jgi:hypothetical protein
MNIRSFLSMESRFNEKAGYQRLTGGAVDRFGIYGVEQGSRLLGSESILPVVAGVESSLLSSLEIFLQILLEVLLDLWVMLVRAITEQVR